MAKTLITPELKRMLEKMTIAEVMKITGFSYSKVQSLRKEAGIKKNPGRPFLKKRRKEDHPKEDKFLNGML